MRPTRFIKSLLTRSVKVEIDYDKLNWLSRFFKRNESWLIFLQLLLVATTVFFTYMSLQLAIKNQEAARDYVQQLTGQLSGLDSSLISINENVNKLPESMTRLDSIVNDMGQNVTDLAGNISEFSLTLNEMNEVTEKQLALLRETQRRWEEELSKKADLAIEVFHSVPSGDTILVEPQIINRGNKTVKDAVILFYVPQNFHFQGKTWGVFDSTAFVEQWSTKHAGPMIPGNYSKGGGLNFTIIILNRENISADSVEIRYQIVHDEKQYGVFYIQTKKEYHGY